MTTLKDVQKGREKLEQFIKEREKEASPADQTRFDKTLNSMSKGKPSKVRKSSPPASSES